MIIIVNDLRWPATKKSSSSWTCSAPPALKSLDWPAHPGRKEWALKYQKNIYISEKKWYYLMHLSNLDNGQGWPKMLHRNEHILVFQCILILIILKQTNFFLKWLNDLSSFQALKSIRTCNQSLRAFPTSEVRQKFAKSLCVEININSVKYWNKMPNLVMATFLMPNMMVKLKGGADFTSSVTRGPYLG